MVSRRGLLSRLGLLAVAGGGLWLLRETVLMPPPRLAFTDGATWSGWAPLEPRTAIPIIDMTVNGAPVRALVDSGAQRSVIDEALATRLGLEGGFSMPMIAVGVSGGARVGRTVRITAALGDLALNGLTVAELDLTPLHGAGAGEIGLVLGQDLLRELVLDLDLAERRLALRAAGETVAGARPVQTRLSGKALHAPVIVEGAAMEALIDTGSSAVLALSSEAANTAGLLDDEHPIRWNQSITFGGVGRGQELTAKTIIFAGRTFERAPVQIYPTSRGGIIPPALLGVGAFAGERVLLDLRAGSLSRVP